MRLLALLVVTLAACSGLKVEGECTYMREVKVTYVCEAGSSINHIKIDHVD